MVTWREERVDSPSAVALLSEYFGSRELDFPTNQGKYRIVFPPAEAFVPPRGVFLVVEGEDLAGDAADVGCGGIRRLDDTEAGLVRYEVKHLYLRPHTRGQGLGRALLAELERRAAAFGAQSLVLDTNASLVAAAGLYHSAGYESIEPYNDNANATNWYEKVLGES